MYPPQAAPIDRVTDLISLYSNSYASAAYFLCDRHDPKAIAYTIIAPDLSSEDLTYGALRLESERLAGGLDNLGLRPGDRIATLMGKGREYLVTVMAIWRLGCVHVPLFTAFAPAAIAFRLAASRSKLVVCDATQRPKLLPGEDAPSDVPWRVVTTGEVDAGTLAFKDLLYISSPTDSVAVGGDAPIVQLYTSGTTGNPKGVLVPLRALASFQVYAEYGLGIRSDDVFWNAADPGWAYGLYFGIITSFLTGVRSILLQGGFSAETTFAVLGRYSVTNFTAAPTVYRALRTSGLKLPDTLKLRCASSAGEPLTPEVIDWSKTMLGVAVHDHYGQTEAGMVINNHHHPALQKPLKPGSMGHAMPGWRTVVLKPDKDEIAATGELGRVAVDLAHSPLAWFQGYVDEPAKSAERFSSDGRWYFTGDTGYLDPEGHFYFSSREDDVIIMAGYRIGPFEVESVLASHPAVAECAVIAVPDEVRGEVLEAVVVLQCGYKASDYLTTEIQDWVKKRFAAHAYPRRVHYVESLPRTPSGKLQRFVLRKKLAIRVD
ncbi:MAG: AMP-binding protein [Acidobacteriaceae bacterium]